MKIETMIIKNARRAMWNAFKKDPDFAGVYKAQIACFIMDNFKGYKKIKNVEMC